MYVKPVSSGILHLLCRFPGLGIVVTVALGVAIFWPQTNIPERCMPKWAVSFNFDDGYASTYEKAYPILKKYDYTGTVYVVTDNIGKPNYMSWNQLKELYDNGWEIGSHTKSHPHLTEIPLAEVNAELHLSKRELEEHGFEVESFASPHGDYNEKIIKIIKEDYYTSHRTAWPAGLNNIPLREDERYELKAVSVEANTTIEQVKEWVVKAKTEGKWLILIFHRINEWGEYNWSSEKLEKVANFVYENGAEGI